MYWLPLVVFAVGVVLPIGLWLLFIRSQDRSEPEPGRLKRRCFYVGIASLIAAAIFEAVLFKLTGLPDDLLTADAGAISTGTLLFAAALIGIIEELAKYLVLRWSVFVSTDFNQVFDGVVYGVTVALGFSFVENAMYFLDIYQTETSGAFVLSVAVRAIFTTLAHVTATGIVGYYLGRAKFSATNKRRLIITGLIAAAALHGLFDFLVISGIWWANIIAGVMIVSVYFIFARSWNDPDVRMVWKYVPPSA